MTKKFIAICSISIFALNSSIGVADDLIIQCGNQVSKYSSSIFGDKVYARVYGKWEEECSDSKEEKVLSGTDLDGEYYEVLYQMTCVVDDYSFKIESKSKTIKGFPMHFKSLTIKDFIAVKETHYDCDVTSADNDCRLIMSSEIECEKLD